MEEARAVQRDPGARAAPARPRSEPPSAAEQRWYTQCGPGCRVRRFYLERSGPQGRLHFMDGTPTAVVFDLTQDEPRVLHWIGLPLLREGGRQWFDLAARAVDTVEEGPESTAAVKR